MSFSSLWVHVKEARVYEPDPNNHVDTRVTVRIGSAFSYSTAKALSPNPEWNEDVMFAVSNGDMMRDLSVELFRPKFFSSELLGHVSISLLSIRHSNKPNTGFWVNLFLPSADDSLISTQHQIRLDMHFEFPKDIPSDVVELLESKLEKLNVVLEEEAEFLETQEHRLITGTLTPPPCNGPDPFSSSSVHDHMNGNHSHDSLENISVTHSMRTTPSQPSEDRPDSELRDIPLEFTEVAPPSQKRVSQSSSSGMSRREMERSEDQALLADFFPNGRKEGMSPVPLERNRLVTPGPVGRNSRLSNHSRESSIGSSDGGFSAFEHNNRIRVQNRWREAMDHHLPEIKKRLEASSPFLSGGHGSLAQLVNQLKSFKMKSKEICEQNIETFSTANSQFRTRSRSVLDVKRKNMYRKHAIDDKVKMDVYRRTLAALIYPVSEPDCHMFEMWSARKPTACSECNYPLWGLKKQGVKCTRCGKICHERCSSLCSKDCFKNDQHSAIREKMRRMSVNHSNRFQMLQEAFNINNEQQDIIKEEVETRILKMAENFNAAISITVLGVQGLLIPKHLANRIYVSVSVGNNSKKTDIYKRKSDDKNPPLWNQEFTFNCSSYHEAIQLRVWNERDSAMAKMASKLTKESDLFLGQKIIEVQRVGPSQEVWYKLEKRTEKGDVSGHIKVNISVSIEGESLTPFHHQYIKLHEQLFFHCHVHNEKDLVIIPAKMETDVQSELTQLLPTVAQEIVDEFALRYAVEPIFRMMLHIELLVSHHSIRSALLVISNMLKNLKYRMFIHVAADHAARAIGATALMEEYMDASNFGRDKFCKILEKLLNSLRLDLQQYREFYPHKDNQKLSELVDTFELMGTVIEFQQQAMGIVSVSKPGELILENMKQCLKNTFDFIVQSNMVEPSTGHPALDTNRLPFDFFYQIIMQIKCVILEDRSVYGKFIKKYCDINFGDVSAVEMWLLFSSTIEGLFDDESNLEVFSANEYITLLVTIKRFYDNELKPIPSRQGKVPEFPRWFVKCVQKWLLQYQKNGIFFLDNAWEDDKNSMNFAAHENQKLSSSAFQMFYYLHEVLDFILSLEKGDLDVKEIHFEDFSKVVLNIVQHYVDKISVAIPEYTLDLDTMCMLLNNLQALRTNIHNLFEEMGGTNTGVEASRILTELQQSLTKQLTSWSGFVARSLTSSVLDAIRTVQSELMKLKGSGGVERQEVKEIVGPLFDLLADRLGIIAAKSEHFVLQKSIKEVWYVCLEGLHHMLLPMLKWEHDITLSTTANTDFPSHHYTSRQCSGLEIMMDLLRDFFKAAESQGIKMSTIDRGIKQLKGVISLYRETTDMLITDFIMDETKNGLRKTDASCGEVYMEIDAFSHPTTGELDGTIRVTSAVGLKGYHTISGLKVIIELNLISPTASSNNKRKFITQARSSHNLHFNETFKFTLANWEASQLLVMAKHKSTFGKDKIIGIGVVACNSLINEASLAIGLAPSCAVSDRGQAILNVLSVRTHDDFAKEFVVLKTSQRSPDEKSQDDLK